eukprot:3777133-Pyramimonas_sp.AAC.1
MRGRRGAIPRPDLLRPHLGGLETPDTGTQPKSPARHFKAKPRQGQSRTGIHRGSLRSGSSGTCIGRRGRPSASCQDSS